MTRWLSVVVVVVLAGGAAWWALGEPSPGPVAGPPIASEAPSRAVRTFESAPDVANAPDAEPETAPAPERPHPAPSDPRWSGVRDHFQGVMGSRIRVVVPDDATPYEAHDLRMDATDTRLSELDDVVAELLDLIETSADPSVRLEARVSLGEAYLEMESAVADTPVPDFARPRKQRRLQADIDERAAVARDKARMVLESAQTRHGAEAFEERIATAMARL